MCKNETSWQDDGMNPLDGQTVLVTGGTGSFGQTFVSTVLATTAVKKVIVLSRDEMKQWEMRQRLGPDDRVRYFIGDVRDYGRLRRAFAGVDLVIHAAALKHVPVAEYNPFEAVKTNIQGAQNVIEAAIDCGVRTVIALSTDKASSPTNLYGATKLVSDKLFVDGNAYAGGRATRFAVVRYGNVLGSRGSVVPFFRAQAASGVLPITDERMTRFWITLPQAVAFVRDSLMRTRGGEIFVPKIPSMRVVDLARAIAPDAELRFIGIRPGEKLHEELISPHDAHRVFDLGDCYTIEPDMEWMPAREPRGQAVSHDFGFTSDKNVDWLDVTRLQRLLVDV